MRKVKIYQNGQLSGTLIQNNRNSYTFRYDDIWFADDECPAISLTFPKTQKEFHSKYLFPFFFNMLSEGINKKLQCRQLKIDDNDYFGLLIATATDETIGAVTVKSI